MLKNQKVNWEHYELDLLQAFIQQQQSIPTNAAAEVIVDDMDDGKVDEKSSDVPQPSQKEPAKIRPNISEYGRKTFKQFCSDRQRKNIMIKDFWSKKTISDEIFDLLFDNGLQANASTI